MCASLPLAVTLSEKTSSTISRKRNQNKNSELVAVVVFLINVGLMMCRTKTMAGFCHFNDNDDITLFEINLFDINFQLKQGSSILTIYYSSFLSM
jgi:hypothetical protein